MQVKKKEYEAMQTTLQAQKIALQNAVGALSVVLIEQPDHKYKEFLESQKATAEYVLKHGAHPDKW